MSELVEGHGAMDVPGEVGEVAAALPAVTGVDLDGDRERVGVEVYQAQGMVAAQLDVSMETALVRLQTYALATDRRLLDVARDILHRKLLLNDNSQSPPAVGPRPRTAPADINEPPAG